MITKRSTPTYQGGAVLLFSVGPENFKKSETKSSTTSRPVTKQCKAETKRSHIRQKNKREKNVCYYIFSESLNAGWISCDRCNKASLHITIPGLEFKSSTNDPREFKSSVAVRTARVRMVLARRLSELQPMRTPKTSRVLVGFPA